jgi:hypothetical protein
MPAAKQSKPRSKPSASKQSKSSAKQSKQTASASAKQRQTLDKMPTARERAALAKQNKRAVAITYADGHKLIRVRPVEPVAHGRGGTVRVEAFAAVADAASAMACVDSDGQPIGRARIGTVQIQRVADAMKKSKTTAHDLVGAKSAKQSLAVLRQYASAKIGRGDLPDGVAANIGALAKRIGDPRVHKMNGRALAAAVVALTEAK